MRRERFTHQWVTSMLASIDEHVNEATKQRLMESCGRACARAGAKASAEACDGDVEAFVGMLQGLGGVEAVVRDERTVDVCYDRCHCELDHEVPQSLARDFCACSCGWLREMFETVTRSPVEVRLESSIRCGADRCRFQVLI